MNNNQFITNTLNFDGKVDLRKFVDREKPQSYLKRGLADFINHLIASKKAKIIGSILYQISEEPQMPSERADGFYVNGDLPDDAKTHMYKTTTTNNGETEIVFDA